MPFAVSGKFLVALPIEIMEGKVKMLTPERMEMVAKLDSSTFFRKAFDLFDTHKTEGTKQTLGEYLNYMHKLEKQYQNKKYVILYNSSGSNTAAAVVDSESYDLPLMLDSTCYYLKTNDENEAWYLCAFLNSETPNQLMKPFQAKGDFGARHIHKKILDVPMPEFDPKNAQHLKAAELAKKAAEKARAYLDSLNLDEQGNNPTPLQTGKMRSTIRTLAKNELVAIDDVVQDIMTS